MKKRFKCSTVKCHRNMEWPEGREKDICVDRKVALVE